MNDAAASHAAAADTARRLQRLRHLRILWQFVAPYRARMIGAALALVIAAGCFLVIGQGLKRVIDMGFLRGDSAALNQALFALLGVIVVMAGATYVRFYLVSWLGERAIADVRSAVFSHLLKLSPAFFEQARAGDLVSRLTADTTLLEQVIGSSVSMAVRNTLLGIGGLKAHPAGLAHGAAGDRADRAVRSTRSPPVACEPGSRRRSRRVCRRDAA